VGGVTSSFNNKGNGTQDFSNSIIIIIIKGGVGGVTSSFNNKGDGTHDFSNSTIIIVNGGWRVGGIRSSYNNKGNGTQDFRDSTIIIVNGWWRRNPILNLQVRFVKGCKEREKYFPDTDFSTRKKISI